MNHVICSYCGHQAALTDGAELYPHRHDLHELQFWICRPCDAWVGCHKEGAWTEGHEGRVVSDGTLPKGRLAKEDLRIAKFRAHQALDPLWKVYHVWSRHPVFTPAAKYPNARRRVIYAWLAKELGIPVHDCHIGMFGLDDCRRVIDAVESLHAPAA